MEKKRTSKAIRRILALIPILLIGAVLVFLNTGHTITIKDNAHYPPEQNGQVYTAAEQNGVVRLLRSFRMSSSHRKKNPWMYIR